MDWKRHYLRLRVGFYPPPLDGMQSYRRLLFAYDCIRKFAHGKGEALEIGCYMGGSTVWLAHACAKVGIRQFSAIDLFTGTPGWDQSIDTFEEARGRLDARGLQDVRLIRGNSQQVDWGAPLSVLHVDGDHAYEAVRADLARYLPHMMPGGVVIIDDYDETHPGVIQATDEAVALDDSLEIVARHQRGVSYGSLCLRRKI